MNATLRVLIVGYGPLGMALTSGVLSCPQYAEIVGIFPWSSLTSERFTRHETSENNFRWFLRRNNLPVISADSVNGFRFTRLLAELQPDVVLVGCWGEILKPHLLSMEKIRFINCHPSLLPKHRGANPYTAVLLAGEAETGITFHKIDENIDTGPILLQRSLEIAASETGFSLRERLSTLAEEMTPELLKKIYENSLIESPQAGDASYDRLDPDKIGWLDWNQTPDELERQLRALYPWYDPKSIMDGKPVIFEYGHIQASTASTYTDQDYSPGTILKINRDGVLVATTDTARPLHLNRPSFIHAPALLKPLLNRLHLRAGKRFTSRLP